jgi:hypothetical protein
VTIGGGIPSGNGQKPDDTMKQKLENFAVSYIEAIAAKRNQTGLSECNENANFFCAAAYPPGSAWLHLRARNQ